MNLQTCPPQPEPYAGMLTDLLLCIESALGGVSRKVPVPRINEVNVHLNTVVHELSPFHTTQANTEPNTM